MAPYGAPWLLRAMLTCLRIGTMRAVEILSRSPAVNWILRAAVAVLSLTCWSHAANAEAMTPAPLPQHLRDTGLYAEGSNTQIDRPQHRIFAAVSAVVGRTTQASLDLPAAWRDDRCVRPDAWEFPRGTRLWKEFSFGRKVETRFIERLSDGSWRFATYIWNEKGTDATLAPGDGVASLPTSGAPHGSYTIPAEGDCRACHEGAAVPVLGFQCAAALVRSRSARAACRFALGYRSSRPCRPRPGEEPSRPRSSPNRPASDADSPAERAALGYLHGNCAHCHNDNGAPVPVDLMLAQSTTAGSAGAEKVLRSMIESRSRFRGHGLSGDAPLVAPGNPADSVLIARVRSRDPQTQMPPLGTQLRDAEAIALLERWISEKSHVTQAYTSQEFTQ